MTAPVKIHLMRATGGLMACGKRARPGQLLTADPTRATCGLCRENIDAGALPKMEPAPSRFELVLEE